MKKAKRNLQKSLTEAGKEWVRVMIVALLPIFYSSVNMVTGEVHMSWSLIAATALMATLKALDKWVHEDNVIKADGLLPI